MPTVDAPHTEDRARVVTRPVRLSAVISGIAVLFIALMLAVSLQGLPVFTPPPYTPPGGTLMPAPEPTSTDGAPPEMPDVPESPIAGILGIVVLALIVIVIAVLSFFIVRRLIRALIDMWRDRPLARQRSADVQGGAAAAVAVAEPDATIIRRGIDAALLTIDSQPVPGDSIIAAWVGLEETSADAGAARHASETPAEFTLRIVGRRGGIADELETLLGLYERVRFGGHEADELDRAAAAACLRRIQEGWR